MKGYELPERIKNNPIGVRFYQMRTKHRTDVLTVVDVYRVINSKDEEVRRTIVCEHLFDDSQIVRSEHPIATLMRADLVDQY